jgi:hypothetical protein
MKVKIGPYKSWIGPYQIAEKIMFWADKNDNPRVHEFGKFLAGENNDSWLHKVCGWIESKRTRTIDIRIDKYDTWSMDFTLATIIVPMLKQLKESKHGAPYVDDKDVPKHLKSTAAPAKKHEWDIDDNHFKRWDWVLDEMIWSFEQKIDDDAEKQFWTGTSDIVWKPSRKKDKFGEPLTYEMKKGPKDTLKYDTINHKKWIKRKNNGFRLFGKYYEGLWD